MSLYRLWKKTRDDLNRNRSQTVNSTPSEYADNESLGLKLLAEGVDPQVDIIAVHGLNGLREKTWTADNGKMWLKDFLPLDIPNARVFAYGYNASTHRDPGIQYLHQHAEDFVDHLSINLQETPRRPIIFIAHSLGGILVKSALIHSENTKIDHLEQHKAIKLSTYGIVFMGTPHQGANTTLGKLILSVASIVTKTNLNLVGNLERDGEWLEAQMRTYLNISNDFDTIYCYETKPTPPSSELVIPYSSAVVQGRRNAPAIGIQQDHTHMVKFPFKNTKGYQDVSLHLKQMVRKATEQVEANWAEWDTLKELKHQRTRTQEIDSQLLMKPTFEPVPMGQERQQKNYFSLSSLQGEWSGEFFYPSGSRRVGLTVSFEPFFIGRTTNGSGFDGRNGEFRIQSAHFSNIPTTDHVGIVTFLQTYPKWPGRVWYYVGTVHKDNNRITGQWHDSPQDHRARIGSFSLERR